MRDFSLKGVVSKIDFVPTTKGSDDMSDAAKIPVNIQTLSEPIKSIYEAILIPHKGEDCIQRYTDTAGGDTRFDIIGQGLFSEMRFGIKHLELRLTTDQDYGDNHPIFKFVKKVKNGYRYSCKLNKISDVNEFIVNAIHCAQDFRRRVKGVQRTPKQ